MQLIIVLIVSSLSHQHAKRVAYLPNHYPNLKGRSDMTIHYKLYLFGVFVSSDIYGMV